MRVDSGVVPLRKTLGYLSVLTPPPMLSSARFSLAPDNQREWSLRHSPCLLARSPSSRRIRPSPGRVCLSTEMKSEEEAFGQQRRTRGGCAACRGRHNVTRQRHLLRPGYQCHRYVLHTAGCRGFSRCHANLIANVRATVSRHVVYATRRPMRVSERLSGVRRVVKMTLSSDSWRPVE